MTVLFCAFAAHATDPTFLEQTIESGLTHTHSTLQSNPAMEFMAAGAAVADFDRDGDQDLFILGGSGGFDLLYINDGSGNFSEHGAQWGVRDAHRGTGAAVADYDNDGDLDLFVTSLGPPEIDQPGHNKLYRNNGDNTFTNVADYANVRTNNPINADAFSSAFGDYDLDGDLDLFVAGWLGGSKLYKNQGDGTFLDTTADLNSSMPSVRGFTPRFVDMNNDRYPEILLAADFGTSKYLINNTDGTFTDATAAAGTGLDSNGMGNTFADFDNDARLDWYVTSLTLLQDTPGSGNMLYQSTPTPHQFFENSISAGCNNGYWSWGADAIDFNHDGFVDIIDTNGYRFFGFENDPTLLFMNDGTGNFADQALLAGINHTGQGRGLLTADFDQDGDRDLLILCNRQPPAFYVNTLNDNPPNMQTNSITLKFNTQGIPSLAPDGFGTRIVSLSDSGTQIRYLDGGSNFLSQSELSVHIGLADDPHTVVSITYTNGSTDTLFIPANQTHTIHATRCAPDLNPDEQINIFDVFAFIDLFNQTHPQADNNVDGVHDAYDVFGFIASYNAGCP